MAPKWGGVLLESLVKRNLPQCSRFQRSLASVSLRKAGKASQRWCHAGYVGVCSPGEKDHAEAHVFIHSLLYSPFIHSADILLSTWVRNRILSHSLKKSVSSGERERATARSTLNPCRNVTVNAPSRSWGHTGRERGAWSVLTGVFLDDRSSESVFKDGHEFVKKTRGF